MKINAYLCGTIINKEDTIMIATIQHRIKRVKSFKEISIQCERIFTLHISNGYGTEKMYQKCETLYFKVLQKNGGY